MTLISCFRRYRTVQLHPYKKNPEYLLRTKRCQGFGVKKLIMEYQYIFEKINAKKKKHLRHLTLDVITCLDIFKTNLPALLSEMMWVGKTGGY